MWGRCWTSAGRSLGLGSCACYFSLAVLLEVAMSALFQCFSAFWHRPLRAMAPTCLSVVPQLQLQVFPLSWVQSGLLLSHWGTRYGLWLPKPAWPPAWEEWHCPASLWTSGTLMDGACLEASLSGLDFSFIFYLLFSSSGSSVLCLTWLFSVPNSQLDSEHFTRVPE
jgi:hypothetical protein